MAPGATRPLKTRALEDEVRVTNLGAAVLPSLDEVRIGNTSFLVASVMIIEPSHGAVRTQAAVFVSTDDTRSTPLCVCTLIEHSLKTMFYVQRCQIVRSNVVCEVEQRNILNR